MASSHLLNPQEFEDLDINTPVVKKFPDHLPDRPSGKKSCLDCLLRNNKFRIVIGLVCFLAMVGGALGTAVFLSRTMQRINQGEAALSAASLWLATTTIPTPLESTVTQTMLVTQISTVTGQITIPISRLQSTVYAIATAPAAPAVTCKAGDTGITCGSLASQPE